MSEHDLDADFEDDENDGLPGWPIVCVIVLTMPLWLPPMLAVAAVRESYRAVRERFQ